MSPLTRALLPDVAAIAGILVVFMSLFSGQGVGRLLGDSDTGWHIVTGQRILATQELPRRDEYSFSKPAGDWYAWEWLSEILLGVVHKAMGLRGVVFLTALALGLGAWGWCRLSRIMGADPLLTGLIAGLALSVGMIHWLARPHVLSWPLLLWWVWRMETMPERAGLGQVLGATLVMALWTNLHGSFFLAFPIALMYAISYWFGERRRAISVMVLVLCAAAATLANPYGIDLHRHLVRFLADTELLARVAEYQSFSFHAPGSWGVIAVLLVAMAGAVLALQQRRWARAMLLLMLLVIAFRSARGIPLLVLAGLPAAVAALTVALCSVESFEGFFRESAAFQRVETQTNGMALACVAVVLAWLGLGWPGVTAATRFPAERYPTSTDECIERLPLDSRVYSPDYLGGFLIYRFNGQRKVFADGRSDYYGQDFTKDQIRIMSVEPGWRDLYRGFRFSHALLPLGAPLRDALQREGWTLLCDDQATVLLSRGDATGP